MAKSYSQFSYSVPGDPEDSSASSEAINDPFAMDLFGSVQDYVSDEIQFLAADPSPTLSDGTPWQSRLPRIGRTEANLSAAVSSLLGTFTNPPLRPLEKALSRFTHSQANEVRISVLDFREEDWTAPNADTFLYLHFSAGPDRLPLIAYFDFFFAIRLIDRALGGTGEPLTTLRTLTIAEMAIIEFVAINLAQAFNQSIPVPTLRLEACGHCPLPETILSRETERFLVLNTTIHFREASGVVTLHFPAAALTALSASGGDSTQRTLAASVEFPRLARLLDVSAHLIIGTTEATLEQIQQLEPDDVLIIERRLANWREGRLSGDLQLRLGEGESTIVTGGVILPEAQSLHISVEHISFGYEPTELERWSIMPDMNDELTQADGAAALDGLVLTVHAEFPARRIRLDELARLRSGQILDLGCTATDLVYLTCDGRRIARGELVDIEGQLGVRILQLLT